MHALFEQSDPLDETQRHVFCYQSKVMLGCNL